MQNLLAKGSRRTPHQKHELIRLTLRRHLRDVIEKEASSAGLKGRNTNITPWPKGSLVAAFDGVLEGDIIASITEVRSR